MDALSRGAAPPGMIDMVHAGNGTQLRNTHLKRRFTMIARYDAKTGGRWSAAGLALSVLVGGVALTGAVRGQDAAPAPAAPAQPAAREISATPAAPDERPALKPAGPVDYSVVSNVDRGTAEKLWTEKYAPRVIFVNGREVNREQVDREYVDDLKAIAAAHPAARQAPAGPVLDEDVDRTLLAVLDRQLPEVNFDGVALADVADFLRDVSGANIVIEWGPLAAAGVERNSPVSLRVKNVKFGRALDLALSSAGGGTVPIGYSVDGNIIRISTLEHLDRMTDVRAYDVRDIVPAEMAMDELAKTIVDMIATESWRDNGGAVGALRVSKHKLIVTQTPMNHRQIRSVLQMLREEPRDAARATDAASAAQASPASPARR